MSLSVSELEPCLQLTCDQLSLLKEFKKWVETNAEFYGRSEEEFLVLFLRSCDFDLELSKKTLRLYYLARVKYPQWWANRDINLPRIQFLMKERLGLLLLERDEINFPAVAIIRVTRMGSDSSILGPTGMFAACSTEVMIRRTNCQLNGGIFIFDIDKYYYWMVWKVFWPPFLRDMLNSFLFCLPMKVKMVVLVNAPSIASAGINLIRSLLPEAYKNKFQCCKDWSHMGKFIPLEKLPVEYGGYAEPIQVHEDTSNNELIALNDFFLEDNKYGFQSSCK